MLYCLFIHVFILGGVVWCAGMARLVILLRVTSVFTFHGAASICSVDDDYVDKFQL